MNQPPKPYNYHFVSPGHNNQREPHKSHQQYQFVAKKTQLNFKYPDPPGQLQGQKSIDCGSGQSREKNNGKGNIPERKYTFQLINKGENASNKSQCAELLSPLEALPRQHPVITKKGLHDGEQFKSKDVTQPTDVVFTPKSKSKGQNNMDSKFTTKKTEVRELQLQVQRLVEENQKLKKDLCGQKSKADKMASELSECRQLLLRQQEASGFMREEVGSLKEENGRLAQEIKQLRTVISSQSSRESSIAVVKDKLESITNLINVNIEPSGQIINKNHEKLTQQDHLSHLKTTNYQQKYRQIATLTNINIDTQSGPSLLLAHLQQLTSSQAKLAQVQSTTKQLFKHLSKVQAELSKLHHINSLLNSQLSSNYHLIEQYNIIINILELQKLERRLGLDQEMESADVC